jgi:ferric iron reductase protein FhuF
VSGGPGRRADCLVVDGAARQQQVAAALPPAARYGLVPPPGSAPLPVRDLTDPDRLAAVVAAHAALYGDASTGVVTTLWWYLASAVLAGPPAAGALAGVPLSADIDDLDLYLGPAGLPAAAVSRGSGPDDPGPALGATLGRLIGTCCVVGGLRPRPLWAIATDSLATRLLALGRARGDRNRATSLARELVASSGAPVPAPRFVDVDGARFLVRGSCCLIYRAGGELCTSCPRRPADERLAGLRLAAPDFR